MNPVDSTLPRPRCRPGTRAPAEHDRRAQILLAADEHFRHFGYTKTTVADLAKAIGVSGAYVYRFFPSKQSIGEAIAELAHKRIQQALRDIAESSQPAPQRLRSIFATIVATGFAQFFSERKLHEIAVVAIQNRWQVALDHRAVIASLIRKVVEDGRVAGDFERKTPIDDVCRGIVAALTAFTHPQLLEQSDQETQQEDALAAANLVLRSLSS
jgi:AcrR family transcriptional regulator